MKFEFKPSENSISFREYLSYLIQTSEGMTLCRKAILPACVISIFSIFTFLLSQDYRIFTYILLITIGVIIFYILVILLILKVVKAKIDCYLRRLYIINKRGK